VLKNGDIRTAFPQKNRKIETFCEQKQRDGKIAAGAGGRELVVKVHTK